MTVLTMPARPGHDTAPPPVPWRRLAWVTWRQHRPTMISVPAVLGALALFLLFAGLKVHHDYAALTACHPQGSAACQTLNRTFNGTDWTLGNTLNILMQLLPVLLGMFAGAPLLARELETGTFRYAWTQGVGRVRLTIAKIAMLAVVITVLAWAFSQSHRGHRPPGPPPRHVGTAAQQNRKIPTKSSRTYAAYFAGPAASNRPWTAASRGR
jgi:hypothetical protein